MFRRMKMLGRMLVLGGIAAADVPAGKTQTKMDPGISHLYAFFASMCAGISNLDLIQVLALISHIFLRTALFTVK